MAQLGKSVLKAGCLGLLGIMAVVALVLSLIGWLQVQGEEITSSGLETSLPITPVEIGLELPDGPIAPAPLSRVLLDIKDADVVIKPVPAGMPLKVEATYDGRYYALEQKPSPDGEDPPIYHVWFRRVHGSGVAMHWLHQLMGASRPQIVVELPRGTPFALELNLSGGLTQAEIGGLQITEVYAELSTGGLELKVSEPSLPMERFRINPRQATLAVRNLGNASPRHVVIDAKMTRAVIDLRGAWHRDAEIRLEIRMGSATLQLPQDVRVVGLDEIWIGEPSEIPRPTLRLTLEGNIGAVDIQR